MTKKLGRPPVPAPERFQQYVTIDSSDCWLWTGKIDRTGYGQFFDGTYLPSGTPHTVAAYRWAYEHFVGPIVLGQVDHICHDPDTCQEIGPACLHRRCVNPTHLRDTTAKQNTLRSNSISAINAKKTKCPQGHDYDYVYNGGRSCRRCRLEAVHRWLEVPGNRDAHNARRRETRASRSQPRSP